MTSAFPIAAVRAQFPALATTDGGRPRIYFDAPGGTQVCRQAIAGMTEHLSRGTANAGGAFASSAETDALTRRAHAAMADLLGAEPGEIAFGPNMTTLTLSVSRALSRQWSAGDEVVVTRLDHDANVAPWLLAARDAGATIRWIDFDPATGRLRLEDLAEQVGPKTKLVALGSASNALGTLNPIKQMVEMVRAQSDALVFVDAVQSVPHLPVDVAELGCDFLVCSPYKFFGPHQGVLWGGERCWSSSTPTRCGRHRSSRRRCGSRRARNPSRRRPLCSAPSHIWSGSGARPHRVLTASAAGCCAPPWKRAGLMRRSSASGCLRG
jgi:cysteine desulfurase family protein (TIGR01976 family)